MQTLEQLNARFSVPRLLQFEAGSGGMTRAVISSASGSAHVYLHGAHVTHYQATGQEPALFLSSKSVFSSTKAIRGGVPICFPFFGPGKHNDPTKPFHGFARTMEWEVVSAERAGDQFKLTLSLSSNDATRASWPFEFRARYIVTVGSQLNLALEILNTGRMPFEFEEALHTYLQVGDVRQVSVTGLEGTDYLDKTQEMKRISQGPKPITIISETDRVYLATPNTCVAHDPVARRKLVIENLNSINTVVWNPWSANAAKMVDMGDGEWANMLCIETCNVKDTSITLPPGKSHTMTAIIRAEPLSS